jgi:uncharacterized SAM-binding protein YcdF (DUF218 family)
MKKFLIFVTVIIVIILALLTQYQFLLTHYARFFRVTNASKGADALVVLAGGILPRLPYAITLYQQGYAPCIILTQARHPYPLLRQVWGDDWEIAAKIAKELNAKVNFVYLPSLKQGGVTSTFDEAYDVKDFSLKHHFKHLIIVTDAYHTRRSLYAFEKVMKGSGVRLEAMGAENDIFNETNWWQTDSGLSAYFMEGVKYIVYHLSDKNLSFIKNY